METFAYALLGLFGIGYFVLGGADIGVGMLLPFLGRDRRLTIAAIAPFFLGNEVWLVATAGLLTAAFAGPSLLPTYQTAIKEKYAFLSYGDSMLIL